MTQLQEDLAKVPLFSDLNQRQLRKLAKGFKEKTIGPGITVVREGHMDGVGFFVIAEGKATVSVSGVNVAVIGPGDYFGELAMITTSARRDRDGRNAASLPEDGVLGSTPVCKRKPRRLLEASPTPCQCARRGSRPTRPSRDPSQLASTSGPRANFTRG